MSSYNDAISPRLLLLLHGVCLILVMSDVQFRQHHVSFPANFLRRLFTLASSGPKIPMFVNSSTLYANRSIGKLPISGLSGV